MVVFVCSLTLQHGEELKPHVDERVVAEEDERHAAVRQDVVEVRHQRPVAVLLHHAAGTVDHAVAIVVLV